MEWQFEQTTSACVCSDSRILAFEISFEWHPRQVFSTWSGPMSENAWMVGLPPPAATCALPGPWQPSQPVLSGSSAPDATDLKCGFLLKFSHTSGWQVLQTVLPTNFFC